MKLWLSWVNLVVITKEHTVVGGGGGGGFPIKRLSMFYWKPNHLQI